MVFTSVEFLFILLPVTLLLYFVSSGIPAKNIVFFTASVLFYAWGEPKTILLVLLSIFINWILGLAIEKYSSQKKFFVVAGVLYNLLILFVFKYFNFFLDNVNNLLKLFSVEAIRYTPIVLPIGISFFTFQILSYVIDVYRGQVKAQRNVMYLGLYILMFPQLIAGPIVRYDDIALQIDSRKTTMETFSAGSRRFMIGFFKKVLIADTVALLADSAFNMQQRPALLAWLGIVAYALQLYYDFSAYSDMAIGLGRIFGFDFLENFKYPYIAKSIKEFWRRWHISLSTWFRDYLYIPLGGSRRGNRRTYINLLIVFFATGLWHGASWNFVVWGLYHGLFLIAERGKFGRLLEKIPVLFRHIYTLAVVMVGWVLFRAETLTTALYYLRDMFSNPFAGVSYSLSFLNIEIVVFMALGIVFSIPLYMAFCKWFTVYKQKNRLKALPVSILHNGLVFIVYCVGVLYMIGSDFSPFIYFRF